MNAQSAFRADEPWPPSPPNPDAASSLLDPAPELEPARDGAASSRHQNDYEACLAYVRQVGSEMRAAAARIRAREATVEEIVTHSRQQSSRAEAALRQSEERVREAAFKIHEAETRANKAEARAAEAEAWLNRLFDTMQQELHGVQTNTSGDSPRPSGPR